MLTLNAACLQCPAQFCGTANAATAILSTEQCLCSKRHWGATRLVWASRDTEAICQQVGWKCVCTAVHPYARFSAFVKAGAEGFMMGTVKDVTIDPNAVLHVVVRSQHRGSLADVCQDNSSSNQGPTWAPNPNPFPHISVEKAGTRRKYKGVKSYEAYNISGVVFVLCCVMVLTRTLGTGRIS